MEKINSEQLQKIETELVSFPNLKKELLSNFLIDSFSDLPQKHFDKTMHRIKLVKIFRP
jgi:hypothetical protein